jgi:hypothetical protein
MTRVTAALHQARGTAKRTSPMLKTRTATALLLAIPALALGACGGSDSDKDANSDEAQITTIVDAVSADPSALCRHLSAEALRAAFEGDEAACVTAAEGEEGDGPATIEEVTVDGDTATVRLTDDRGPDTARFAKEDGEWKVVLD